MHSCVFIPHVGIRAQATGLNIGCPISGPVPRAIEKRQSESRRIETSCALIFDFARASTSLKGNDFGIPYQLSDRPETKKKRTDSKLVYSS